MHWGRWCPALMHLWNVWPGDEPKGGCLALGEACMLVDVEQLSEMTNIPQFFTASSKQHLIHLEPLGEASQYQNTTLFHTMPRQSGNLGKRVSMRSPHMRDYTSYIAKGLPVHLTSIPRQCSNRCVFCAHPCPISSIANMLMLT